jgi:Zn-dependent M28 family amino/carboxypeptidase
MQFKFIFVAVLVFVSQAIFSQEISEKSLRKHVTYLASDKLKGRATGTPQELKAAQYIAKQFKKIGLKPKGDDGTFFHKFGFKKSSDPHGGIDEKTPQVYSQNVAGYLDNGAANTIVIGAHYDHLGLGYDHNSLDANPEGKIHNGADDNASGTSGVIELARYFAENGVKEANNFLFLCFSGEELGLIGSKRYTEYPTIDLTKVSFMVNMDMIGRLNAEKKIVIGGVGTAPDFVPLFKSITTGLSIKLDSAGVGPSDHTSFYLKNIPVLFFFTGQHSDYHKPSDDTELVNFSGTKQVLDLAAKAIQSLDKPAKLTFQETKANEDNTPRFKVTLGIMPDYTFEGEGVRADGVTDGKPASKAGIVKGDIIIGLGDMEVKSMKDYMKALAAHQKGDTVKVKVKRGEMVKTLDATF